jgi:hypothetical protein
LVVELERIPDGERRTEEELWERFEAEHPKLLGALFGVLAEAIALKPSLKLSRRPRLADWGEYAAAVYEVMGWGAEQFLEDWDEVVKVQNQATLDSSPVAQAIIKFMEDREEYTASSSEMHSKLKVVAATLGVDVERDKAWPKSARWLWRRIKEVLPLLVAASIEVSRKDAEKATELTLRKLLKSDSSDSSKEESGGDKQDLAGNNDQADSRSNSSNCSNSGPNSSAEQHSYAGSGNTGNTGIRNGGSSQGADIPVSVDLGPGEISMVKELRARRESNRRKSTEEQEREIQELVADGMAERFARAEVLREGAHT